MIVKGGVGQPLGHQAKTTRNRFEAARCGGGRAEMSLARSPALGELCCDGIRQFTSVARADDPPGRYAGALRELAAGFVARPARYCDLFLVFPAGAA